MYGHAMLIYDNKQHKMSCTDAMLVSVNLCLTSVKDCTNNSSHFISRYVIQCRHLHVTILVTCQWQHLIYIHTHLHTYTLCQQVHIPLT